MNMNRIKRFLNDESGNATEYVLIVALISIAIIGGAVVLGKGLDLLFANSGKELPQ